MAHVAAEARPGSLLRLRMRNFSSRSDIDIELQPYLNVVLTKLESTTAGIGYTSSMLVAIRLALGRTVANCESHSSVGMLDRLDSAMVQLESLVRRDGDSNGVCTAEVVLCNSGSGCLPQAVWGDSILLKRKLTLGADGRIAEDTLEAFADDDVLRPIRHRNDDGELLPPAKQRAWLLTELEKALRVDERNPMIAVDEALLQAFERGTPEDRYRVMMEVRSASGCRQRRAGCCLGLPHAVVNATVSTGRSILHSMSS